MERHAATHAWRRKLSIGCAAVSVVALTALLYAAEPSDAAASAVDAPAQTRIASADFESTSFPPVGWRVVDQQSSPPAYVWDRETCEVDPGTGGAAAAWALGGGSGGSGLACGSTYADAVDTFLIYGPIDTRPFDEGIRVSLMVWLDMPASQSFIVCATHGPGESDFQCFETGVTETDWASFAPLDFPLTAGRTDVEVWINYRDREPSGGHVGAFVDNVTIDGLSSGAPPTVTATSSATATGAPQVTPSSTVTLQATATASVTPSRTATSMATGAASATASRTATSPTVTPSATRTGTTPTTPGATATRTATTGAGTATATVTASAIPTGSGTPVPSATMGGTTTVTPGATDEATPTGTGEATPTGTEPAPEGYLLYLPIANRGR